MNKVYFGMCLHFHQPVGNFDDIVERAYQNCYKPFLDVFEKYPEIKMAMHFSGCLLDYFERVHPDYLDRVKVMAARGQVEIIGGGYYEPIFVSIPKEDRFGQIKMMSDYVKKRFGQKPGGMWTPERVWVPELAGDFNKADMRYTILDDEHFIKAGLKQEDLLGYFTTGEKNSEIAVFPSNKPLRYMIPFKMPAEVINYFKEAGSKSSEPLFTYGDDAEKFGEWPFTHDWVYKQNWLGKFFDELMRNKDWVETIKLSDYLKSNPPVKKIKIPEASYQEMMEWSGGSWMNFLKKYPETNQMFRKMHYVSKKVNSVNDNSALRELYKGQCNCAYWHGVFGGLYLYHLRKAIYEHLINAEKIADEALHKGKKDWIEIRETDFYENSKKAFIIENKEVSVCIDPGSGGIIREMDVRKAPINIVNSIARHEEEYHKKILAKMGQSSDPNAARTIHEDVKTIDPGLKGKFVYDKHIRGCLVDHFIDSSVSLQDFIDCKYEELGDFINAVYKGKKTKDKVILEREGSVGGRAISIAKEIKIRGRDGIEVLYTLKNLGKADIEAVFGVEFNLTMSSLNSDRYSYFSESRIAGINDTGAVSDSGLFSIKDSGGDMSVDFIFSKKAESIWYFPVKTISQSERAYELNFQASCIIPRWKINLPCAKQTSFSIIWSF
ncbi:MAG: DUF1926 domain-containing protein [Candidatus Omnitrophota bacterium]|nr:DUF1926 domain-containing protein [Candidatus Omnitrophota bacterium]